MSRSLLILAGAGALPACLAPPDGAGAGDAADATKAKPPKAEKPVKPPKITQNGFKRPEKGSVTGRLWDIADHISEQQNKPATRKQVVDEYMKVPGANLSTANTQYARWVGFHGVGDVLKANRKADQAQAQAARDAKKAEAKVEADKKKAEKDAAKAQAKAQADAEKAAKQKNKAAA